MSRKVGNQWEKVAESYLLDTGYKILDMNYNTKYGEIDVVAFKDSTIVFVEVKFRKNNEYGYAYEYVNKSKINKLMRAIELYLSEHEAYIKMDKRIDVIAFDSVKKVLNHYKDISLL